MYQHAEILTAARSGRAFSVGSPTVRVGSDGVIQLALSGWARLPKADGAVASVIVAVCYWPVWPVWPLVQVMEILSPG